jgi:hypothetical protein
MTVMKLPRAIAEQPRTIEEWKRLPELGPGRYKVTDIGGMNTTVANCRASGVQGLPPPQPDEARLAMNLPNIRVVENGAQRLYRLGLEFGPIIRAIFDEYREWYALGRRILPAYYSLGMDTRGAFVIPDGVCPRRNVLLN